MTSGHAESWTRCLDVEAFDGVAAVVGRLLAPLGISTSGWNVTEAWGLLAVDVGWIAHVECRLAGSVGDLGSLMLRVPSLLNDKAWMEAPRDLRIGRQQGLYVGRPLVPVAQMRDTPGFGIRWRSNAASIDPEESSSPVIKATTVVVPEFGGGLFHNEAVARLRRVWVNTFQSLWSASEDQDFVVTPVGVFTREQAQHLRSLFPAIDPDPTGRVTETREIRARLLARVRELVDEARRDLDERPGSVIDALKFAPAQTRIHYYGHTVTETIALAAARSANDVLTSRGSDPARVGRMLSWRIQRHINDLVSAGSSLTVADTASNTLAACEAGRQVTTFGPFGLKAPVRGSLDLRDLHPGWRGTLCPLQTPESADISLVRYLAIGAGDSDQATLPGASWRDLSWSAALIPFINHNEQARAILAAKNLKQAVPLTHPELPLVRTGAERALAERWGVLRAPRRVTVVAHRTQGLLVRGAGPAEGELTFGPADAERRSTNGDWITCVAEGERAGRGQVVAHAPDVRLDDEDVPHLALGTNLMVAVTPWHGYNYEDAIVISDRAARKLEHHEQVTIHRDLLPGEWIEQQAVPGTALNAGRTVALVRDAHGAVTGRFAATHDGVLGAVELDAGTRRLTAWIRVRRTLEVGDKITNRHGGKGIVSLIVPLDEMPRLPDGTPVDAIVSPVGIVRRLNVGQAYEMAVGLAAHLRGDGPLTVGRRLEDRATLAALLRQLGAAGGRLPLHSSSGAVMFDGAPVMVGPQYFLRLHHLAEKKLSARGGGAVSPVTGQPSRTTTYHDGRRVGAAQRMGEMELWGLQAKNATRLLHDALWARGADAGASAPRPAFISAVAHLAAMGLGVLPAASSVDGATASPKVQPLTSMAVLQTALALAVRGDVWSRLVPMTGTDFASSKDDHSSLLPSALDPDRHPLYSPRFGGPDDDERVTRCFDLGVAYHAGGALGRLGAKKLARARLAAMTRTWCAREGIDDPAAIRDVWRLALLHGAQGLEPALQAFGNGLDDGMAALRGILGGPQPATDAEPTAAELSEIDAWSTRLPVLPRRYRTIGHDRLDELYLRLAAQLRLDRTGPISHPRILGVVYSIIGGLQEHDAVFSVYPVHGYQVEPRSLHARLAGHDGLLRHALLGTSTFYSGRGVIVPDPDRRIDSVGLPVQLLGALLSGDDPDLGGQAAETTESTVEQSMDVVYIVRQPTLRPANIVALHAESTPGDVIRIHPDLCEALAGDFDGDTVAVHRPRTAAARDEALALFGPAANLVNPANGSYLVKQDLDLSLGEQVARHRDPSRAGGSLAEMLDASSSLPPSQRLTLLAERQHQLWEMATGWSIGFVDLPSLPDTTDDELAARLSTARHPDPLAELGTLHTAGAAGKIASLRQLLVARGVQNGFNPLLPDRRLDGCFLNGLEDDEYFEGARASAARLAEKKLLTPAAGGFTKLLAEIMYEVRVGREDCGVKGSTVGPSEHDVSQERSPLYCRDPQPCAACVGTLPDGATSRPGDRVGLLAAMLIGERSTQLAMKTFHGGGSDAIDLPAVRALMGFGSSALLGSLAGRDKPISLGTYLADAAARASSVGSAASLGSALEPVAAAVSSAFGGAVSTCYIDLVLHRLAQVWCDTGARSLAVRSKTDGRDPFVTATIHGTIPKASPPAPDAAFVETARLALLRGSPM